MNQPLFPGQPNTYSFVTQPDELQSPFLAYKFEYGTNLGGPVRRDKVFFFVNYEGAQASQNSAQDCGSLPGAKTSVL